MKNGVFTHDNVESARPAKHFAIPPYRAELFNEKTGWAGVMNKNGFNCLTFEDNPGAVISDYESCKAIAERWNNQLGQPT